MAPILIGSFSFSYLSLDIIIYLVNGIEKVNNIDRSKILQKELFTLLIKSALS